MGENSNQIEREIRAERGQLGRNLNDLQSKVEEVTDWRAHFNKRPITMIGAALGGGLLLASMTGGRSKRRRHYAEARTNGENEHRRGTEIQKGKALETVDSIKGALIGVAANTFQNFLGQVVPGFREQFEKTTQEKRSGTTPGTPGSRSMGSSA
jgi:ribosome-associated protein YbcJ (S4-like RNA binding protein)